MKSPPTFSPTGSSRKNNSNNSNKSDTIKLIDGLCARIEQSLDTKTWAPIRYHKDTDSEPQESFSKTYISSIEEDDADARATIDKFNKIATSNNPVLTQSLFDHGITLGNDHRALSFLEKLTISQATNTPVNIAVFGNSFTIGSNCAESTVDDPNFCAWPYRARKRLNELLSNISGTTSQDKENSILINWHMWQENAQASVIIANKLPTFIDFFSSRNSTVDAILIDTSMTEPRKSRSKPWFEAVIRAMHEIFPNVVVLSIIDGKRNLVTPGEHSLLQWLNNALVDYVQWLRDVQEKYQVTVVDIAKMVAQDNKNQNVTHPVDRLWPQSEDMTDSQGIQRNETYMLSLYDEVHTMGNEFYWTNFVPRVRKKVAANYPNAHPPWPTHQYVADTVTQALLRTAHRACVLKKEKKQIPPSALPVDTVSAKESVQACSICLDPLTSIDAKKPPKSDVVTTICGDWKWITDDRNRAGWQSDEVGSLLRIRFEMGTIDPLVLLTYTGSYATFGNFRVTFRRPNENPPLTNCTALSTNKSLPSLEFSSSLLEHTLPKIAIFPSKDHLVTREEFKLLNSTILSSQSAEQGNKTGQTVDMYIENTGDHYQHRVKIHMVTAC